MKGAMTRACLTIYKILHSTLALLLLFYLHCCLFVLLLTNSVLSECVCAVCVSSIWCSSSLCRTAFGCKYSRLQYVIVVGGIDFVFFFSLSKKAFWVMSSCSNHTNNKHKQLNTNNIAFIIDGIPLPLMLRGCVCVCIFVRKGVSELHNLYWSIHSILQTNERMNGEHTTELLSIFRSTVTVTVNSIRYQFNRIND